MRNRIEATWVVAAHLALAFATFMGAFAIVALAYYACSLLGLT